MRVRHTLRFKVALGFSLATLLLLLAQSVGVRVLVENEEEKLIDEMVNEEMTRLVQDYTVHPQMLPPLNRDLNGYVSSSDGRPVEFPAYVRTLTFGVHEIVLNERELHVAIAPYGNARLYRLYDFSQYERRLKQFAEFLMVGTGVFALLTIWLAFALSGLLVRQVSDLARQVKRIRLGESLTKLTGKYTEREVVELAQTFNSYHRRVGELIEQEKEFTANVSHELRTPLTAIKTSCELLLLDKDTNAKSRQRLEGISQNTDRMVELIESLLMMARDKLLTGRNEVSIKACLEEASQPFLQQLAVKGVSFDARINPEAKVLARRDALVLVLANLIRNAVTYTERGSITARYQGHVLRIEDTGIGIDQTDVRHVFNRFYRGKKATSDGSGLGLAIVKRVCDHCGWRISLESERNRGTCITIEFPQFA